MHLRLILALTVPVVLACGGLSDLQTPALPGTEAEVPPPAPAEWPYVLENGQHLVKTGPDSGLVIGETLVLLGPPLAGTENRQIVASADVVELWPDLARVDLQRQRKDAPAAELARKKLPEDQATLDALDAAPPVVGKRAGAAGGGPAAGAGAPAEAAEATPNLPSDLTQGSADDRISALERYERDGDMTSAIVWVMKNDPSSDVRFKAWRVVRARWNRGTGSDAAHEGATVWASTSGPERMRVEALELLGEKSSNVQAPARSLSAGSPEVRIAAGAAVRDVGQRTGRRSEARSLLQARKDKEENDDVRRKLGDFIGDL